MCVCLYKPVDGEADDKVHEICVVGVFVLQGSNVGRHTHFLHIRSTTAIAPSDTRIHTYTDPKKNTHTHSSHVCIVERMCETADKKPNLEEQFFDVEWVESHSRLASPICRCVCT